MADEKISQLSPGGALEDTDLIPVARAGETVSVAGSEFGGSMPFTFVGSGEPASPVNALFDLFAGDHGSPTNSSGTFSLTFRGQTTSPLAFNETIENVGAALTGLSTIGVGNLISDPRVSPGSTVNDFLSFLFVGSLGRQVVEAPTVSSDTTDNGVSTEAGARGETAGSPAGAEIGDTYFDDDGLRIFKLTGSELDFFWRTGATETQYSGSQLSVENGALAALPIDTLVSGTELLDRSDPPNCSFLRPGKYAITAHVHTPSPGEGDTTLTVGGYAVAELRIDGVTVAQSEFIEPMDGASVSAVVVDPPNLGVTLTNNDGAVARNFFIEEITIARL